MRLRRIRDTVMELSQMPLVMVKTATVQLGNPTVIVNQASASLFSNKKDSQMPPEVVSNIQIFKIFLGGGEGGMPPDPPRLVGAMIAPTIHRL